MKELDSTYLCQAVAAFRIVPYIARDEQYLQDLADMEDSLDSLSESSSEEEVEEEEEQDPSVGVLVQSDRLFEVDVKRMKV